MPQDLSCAGCPAPASSLDGASASVAQLDRVLPSEGRGHRFESCRVHHFSYGAVRMPMGPAVPSPQAARDMTLVLLAARASEATICPSEVARALGTDDWRVVMPVVHEAIDRLLIDGMIRLSWKGKALPTRSGPYRISRVGRGSL